MAKEYIGDSVYVEYDGFYLILTTENGVPDDPSNRIMLEPAVYGQLIGYVDRLLREEKAAAAHHGLTGD